MWSFGVLEPGCYGAIEVTSGASHLFVPRLPASYAVWMGPLHSLEDFSAKYGIPNVHYSDEVSANSIIVFNNGLCFIFFINNRNQAWFNNI